MVNKKRVSERASNEVFDWLNSILCAFLAVLLIFTFVFRIVKVDGISMNKTLEEGDRLIIGHYLGRPEYGDIVVANCEGLDKVIIKRVIATEGQTVDIDFSSGAVFVDGKKLSESYINNLTINDEYGHDYPVTVPPNCVFVMGDNRQHSTDSRSPDVSFVSVNDIIGKALIRITPLEKFGSLYNN